MSRLVAGSLLSLALVLGVTASLSADEPLQVSGIYPQLASFNGGGECGIGAVVPWAGRLWWITYPPHQPQGGPDKLFSIDEKMELTVHPESVGGTHAGRLIHRESKQLIIGPYFISEKGEVRACNVKTELIGRITAVARHLTDPANLVYIIDMEGRVYEVNVHTLAVKLLFRKPVPGWHGKGGYTGQGRLVISNNGENSADKLPADHKYAATVPAAPENAGVLAEFDGKTWNIIKRRQFLDVTGPGGILGAPDDKAPLWSIGWDKRSVMLCLCDQGQWSTFRLPKGSYAFDPSHGWYTEWPRIREITDGRFLLNMHGQFFDFPKSFSAANTAGIRPLCTHLRYVPDFCGWGKQLVIASDDTSIMRNPLAGQSQSNLWFGAYEDLKSWGPSVGWGGVWVGDHIKAGEPSDPFLVAGYDQRVLHLSHNGEKAVTFTLEADEKGNGQWKTLTKIEVPAAGYKYHLLPADAQPEWVRLVASDACRASAYWHLGVSQRPAAPTKAVQIDAAQAALVRPAKGNRNLQVKTATGYYEVNETLTAKATDIPAEATDILPKWEIKPVATKAEVNVEGVAFTPSCVVVTDHKHARWLLPKTDAAYDSPPVALRGVREIQSERYLANWHGLFYEIPRTAGTSKDKDYEPPHVQKIKPVATHRAAVVDFCTWRGMLVLAGGAAVPGAGKTITTADGKLSLWFGKSDDLWRFGKPTGHGGPWQKSAIKADTPSDPFLMTNFDQKSVTLSHDAKQPVTFTIQVDFLADGTWRDYGSVTVNAGETKTETFPAGYSAHWVRLKADQACAATAEFEYK